MPVELDAAGLSGEEFVAVLFGGVPEPVLVTRLAGVDPERLSASARVDLLLGWERVAAWVAARQVQVLAAIDAATTTAGAGSWEPLADLAREEVAAALAISPGSAAYRLDVARTLTTRLPGTAAALDAGTIGYAKAQLMVAETACLDDLGAARVEAAVLEGAPGWTPQRLRARVRAAVIAADPAGAEERATAARVERGVRRSGALPEGMAGLFAVLPAADAQTVWAGLTATADRIAADLRDSGLPAAEIPPIDARRADALLEWAQRALADPGLPASQGQRPGVVVTVGLSTLLGLDQQAGELAGYGPIDAHTARRIATEGTWRRLVYDPVDGTMIDYGRTRYRPPADLCEHVIARDRTCSFPGCPAPACRCDLDHIEAFDGGGGTDRANLHPLCRRHHRCKHETGWQVTRAEDCSTTWTSPAGKTYTIPAARHGPDPPIPDGIDPDGADEDGDPGDWPDGNPGEDPDDWPYRDRGDEPLSGQDAGTEPDSAPEPDPYDTPEPDDDPPF